MDEMHEAVTAVLGEIDFDPEELHAKYLSERDKRLRDDHNDQYVEVTGEFSKYLDDPYEETVEREPLFDEVEIAIIGGGFGGLLMGEGSARPASPIFALSSAVGISAEPGIGIVTPEQCATSKAIATCRCSRSSTTYQSINIPSPRKLWSTRKTSDVITGSTRKPALAPL